MNKIKLDSRLLQYLLYGLIGLLIIASLSGTDSIVSLLQGQTNALLQLKAKNQALKSEQTSLISARKEVVQYTPLKNIAESIVPQDKNQAQAVREIVALAAASNITLTSITFPSSTLGNNSGAVVPTSAAGTAASLSQLVPVTGIPGVYSLAIQIQNDQNSAVSYTNFYNFLTKLEQNRLTSQVTGLSIEPLTAGNGNLTFTLTINEYIRPNS